VGNLPELLHAKGVKQSDRCVKGRLRPPLFCASWRGVEKERPILLRLPYQDRRWLMADWQKIKTEYITTDTSYRKLAQKYGVSYNAIGNRSRDEKWQDLRDQHLSKTMTKTMNAISSKQADRAAKLFSVSDKLLDKVQALLEADEELLVDTTVMKDVSVILKNLKDIQMIRSEADLREQEARIDKLRKEAKEDGSHKEPIKIILGDGLDKYSM
jgi:hypothetical protein